MSSRDQLITAANLAAARKMVHRAARQLGRCSDARYGRLLNTWERLVTEYEELIAEAADEVLYEHDSALARRELSRRRDGHAIII